jgi:hypothetical protein
VHRQEMSERSATRPRRTRKRATEEPSDEAECSHRRPPQPRTLASLASLLHGALDVCECRLACALAPSDLAARIAAANDALHSVTHALVNDARLHKSVSEDSDSEDDPTERDVTSRLHSSAARAVHPSSPSTELPVVHAPPSLLIEFKPHELALEAIVAIGRDTCSLLAHALLKSSQREQIGKSADDVSLRHEWCQMLDAGMETLAALALHADALRVFDAPRTQEVASLLCELILPVNDSTAAASREGDTGDEDVQSILDSTLPHALRCIANLCIRSTMRERLVQYRDAHSPTSGGAPHSAQSRQPTSAVLCALMQRYCTIQASEPQSAGASTSPPSHSSTLLDAIYLLLQQSSITCMQAGIDTVQRSVSFMRTLRHDDSQLSNVSEKHASASSSARSIAADDARRARFQLRWIRALIAASSPLVSSSATESLPLPLTAMLAEPSWSSFLEHAWERQPILLRSPSKDERTLQLPFSSSDLASVFTCGISAPLPYKYCASLAEYLCESVCDGAGFDAAGRHRLEGMRNQIDCTILQSRVADSTTNPPLSLESCVAAPASSSAHASELLATSVLYGSRGSLLPSSDVTSSLGSGHTVTIRGLLDRDSRISAVARQLSARFGQCNVSANLYVTPPRSQGFMVHYDDHCVFVLQLEGRKRWNIWDQVDTLPQMYQQWSARSHAGSSRRA